MTGIRYDAGTEREELTMALARWLVAGFIDGWRAERLRRRIGRLARTIGRPRQDVHDELWTEARAMLDADETD